MSEVRRDSKGRRLFTGETQRKDGKYEYKYLDSSGKRGSVYSWRLTPADSTPKGKKKDISLREKEKQIQEEARFASTEGVSEITVNDQIEKYINSKAGIRRGTRRNYNMALKIAKESGFGNRKISSVKIYDAKEWFVSLHGSGKSYGFISIIREVVKPAFQSATEEDLISKNPFDFKLSSVIPNDSKTRNAITKDQESKFLDFIRNDKNLNEYYEGAFILFHTGLRVSELAGLTIKDVDLVNKTISVKRQLQRIKVGEYEISQPKTKRGTRVIPISETTRECIKNAISKRPVISTDMEIDGIKGFLFLDKRGLPMVANHWEQYLRRACKKYNEEHDEKMPSITPHVCRHTFCSNMARIGMNPKVLQYIMGHSNISVTLNTYTHVTEEDAIEEFRKMEK